MVNKKYKVVITTNAQKSIIEIHNFIALNSKSNAKKVVTKFLALIKSAKKFPYKHPIDDLQININVNERYIGVWSFKIHFEIDNNKDVIIVHHVSHTSQSPENITKTLKVIK